MNDADDSSDYDPRTLLERLDEIATIREMRKFLFEVGTVSARAIRIV